MSPAPADELSIAERVDANCDRFEAEFASGRRPRLEEYLGTATEPFRIQLFRGLLELELELRRRAGELPQRDEYIKRFPEYSSIVELVLAELSGGPSRRFAARDSSVNASAAETSRGPAKATTNAATPQEIARFQIAQLLGEGAFGAVYKARDPQLDRDVALKVPRAGTLSPTDRERFLREARSAAGLHHANICPVHEVGTTPDGRDYIVMAFIDGKPLSKVLQSGTKINERQIASLIRRLAQALDEAHQKGVIHRDLKPANIMVNRKGEPVIMDFGLARRSSPDDAQLSMSGQIMGTPAYMSPEQARGDTKTIGPATDIYSLGVVLYEMLCGQRPFSGTVTEVIGKILHVDAPPPSQAREGIDPKLQAICMKAIAKNPADRYASMKDFAAALTEFIKSGSTSPAAAPQAEVANEPAVLSEFARLAESIPARSKLKHAPQPSPQTADGGRLNVPWWRGRRIQIAGGLAAMALLGVIVITITRKDGSKAQLTVPGDLQSVDVTQDGKPVAKIETSTAKAIPGGQTDPPAATPSEWTDLLNGKDLAGWKTVGPESWTVRDGAVFASGEQMGHLVCDRVFDDFELSGEVYAEDKGNGAICFHVTEAPQDGGLQRGGYEFQVAGSQGDPGGNFTGGLYADSTTVARVQPPIVGDRVWSKVRVRVEGTRLQGWVGDRQTFDVQGDPGRLTGRLLTLQSYAQGGVVGYRNLRIRPLTSTDGVVGDNFVSLFNGKDLTGWKMHPDGPPNPWRVENGILTADTGTQLSMLMTERGDYRDVHVRAEAMNGSGTGAGGIKVRAPFDSDPFVPSYSVNLTGNRPVQSERKPKTARPPGAGARITSVNLPVNTWVTVELIVRGFHVTVIIDGKLVEEYDDPERRRESGHIALPRGPATNISFRKIEVKELSTATDSSSSPSSTAIGADDYSHYAAGPWTKLWDTEDAVKAALKIGAYGDDAVLRTNGVLTLQNTCVLRGPGPVRNLAVRLRLKHEEGKGCYINFRSDLAENGSRYTNWINGYKVFGLGRHDEGGKFTELGGHADLPNLQNGQFYEWLGVADGNSIAIFINGKLLLKMEDAAIASGYFAVVVSDGAATIRDAEYRILDAPASVDPDRKAAEWVLSFGGQVKVAVGESISEWIKAAPLLPREPFRLHSIFTPDNGKPWQDSDLGVLSGLTGIKSINFEQPIPHGDATMEVIETLTGLERLRFEDPNQITDAGLRRLVKLTNLRALGIVSPRMTDSTLEVLVALPQLEDLSLGITGYGSSPYESAPLITANGLAHFKTAPKLLNLNLYGVPVDSNGLQKLGECRQVLHLKLGGSAVSDVGLQHLAGMTQLITLRLNNTAVTDAGLAHLKSLQNLDQLDLSGSPVTGSGAEPLRGLDKLRRLVLWGSPVDDAGLQQIKSLTQLTLLDVRQSKVSDAGMPHLVALAEKLEVLHLIETAITDDAVPHLGKLTKLRGLTLNGTQMTADGVQRLREALPACSVSY